MVTIVTTCHQLIHVIPRYSKIFQELLRFGLSMSVVGQALPDGLAAEWTTWLQSWAAAVLVEGDVTEVTARLKAVNPKYVPREWMLADAYDKALLEQVVESVHAVGLVNVTICRVIRSNSVPIGSKLPGERASLT